MSRQSIDDMKRNVIRLLNREAELRKALNDFDNSREANQWPNTGQSRQKDADEFIERVREILRHNDQDHTKTTPKLNHDRSRIPSWAR